MSLAGISVGVATYRSCKSIRNLTLAPRGLCGPSLKDQQESRTRHDADDPKSDDLSTLC